MESITVILSLLLIHIILGPQGYEALSHAKSPRGHVKPRNVEIIGGDEVEPHSIPYQAGLWINSKSFFCGGALISENYVLTAAHCAIHMRRVDVVLGAHNISNPEESTQVKIPGEKIIIHEEYNNSNYRNDIALIKLASSAPLNGNIKTINLPVDSSQNYEGKTAKATGWGLVKDVPYPSIYDMSDVLMGVDVEVDTLADCKDYYNDEQDIYVTTSNICTSGYRNKGTCDGDSGGPLVIDGVLVGATSFGTTVCEFCTPSVYTNVAQYLAWISKNSDCKI